MPSIASLDQRTFPEHRRRRMAAARVLVGPATCSARGKLLGQALDAVGTAGGKFVITLEQHVRPHPEVVDTELWAGETVLLHLESKTYYSLNLTDERIWRGVKGGLT